MPTGRSILVEVSSGEMPVTVANGWPPERISTLYDVSGALPVSAGGVHETVTDSTPGVAEPMAGAAGSVHAGTCPVACDAAVSAVPCPSV